ncbi:uncharacterized protein LOC113326706 [Papaver somniferum]|uniref:uncharacterized protein LOC113326706 n=1 Tax=Papaver somniferum TaxID=3469 RepID=UPI000E6FD0FA|nr:uncharacterized protein LOC113326706 [Papaver somniferum]
MSASKTSLVLFLFALIAISENLQMVSALGLVIEVSALGLKCGGEALVIVKLPPGDSCAAVIPLHPQYCDNHCQNACPVGLKLGVAPCVDNLISVGYAYCGCCCIPI